MQSFNLSNFLFYPFAGLSWFRTSCGAEWSGGKRRLLRTRMCCASGRSWWTRGSSVAVHHLLHSARDRGGLRCTHHPCPTHFPAHPRQPPIHRPAVGHLNSQCFRTLCCLCGYGHATVHRLERQPLTTHLSSRNPHKYVNTPPLPPVLSLCHSSCLFSINEPIIIGGYYFLK